MEYAKSMLTSQTQYQYSDQVRIGRTATCKAAWEGNNDTVSLENVALSVKVFQNNWRRIRAY
jgi:hypothetical protein